MVTACLGGRVWTMRIVWSVFAEKVGAVWRIAFRFVKGKGAIDFVGGDVIETARDSYVAALLRMTMPAYRLPVETGSLEKGKGAENICAGKGERILDGTVNV